jgi:hypothetical protein
LLGLQADWNLVFQDLQVPSTLVLPLK